MVKLKYPLNYRGVIIDAGSNVGFLSAEMQEKLIKNGLAELVKPDSKEGKKEKALDEMTKTELLEYAQSLQVDGVTDKMTKAEILEELKEHLDDGHG